VPQHVWVPAELETGAAYRERARQFAMDARMPLVFVGQNGFMVASGVNFR
jgi:hypothetical protein